MKTPCVMIPGAEWSLEQQKSSRCSRDDIKSHEYSFDFISEMEAHWLLGFWRKEIR